ncbi:thioesterase domain-containing protein [Bacillus glycinifermentans]|nr:thioesterase domain-containing protein [Bacillus glycinifermentans]MEC0494842.1 thioesterase domain-containing protein [Bacillus glycinifermentans]MEC0541014.1 thioesterase domain-containing protein [Bacillus glycinifermentans]
MNLNVPLQAIFQYPRIRQLAGHIASSNQLNFDQMKGHMVRLSENGTKNLYCFPGIGGVGYIFYQLSQAVPDWNCYGINFVESPDRIDEYVNHIKRVQPHGPYYFLAYSAGAALAYEVIKRLESGNGQVEQLILFDCKMESGKETYHQQKVTESAEEFVEQFIITQFLKENDIQDPAQAAYLRKEGLKSVLRYFQYYQEMVFEQPIHAEIHRIEADHEKWNDQDLEKMTTQRSFTYRGYGSHQEMLASPFVEQNAEILAGILNKVKSM